MSQGTSQEEAVAKLGHLIKDIKIAMLTTLAADGNLHSRPMAAQQQEFGGDLWFFTGLDGAIKQEIERDPRVNVSFSNPSIQIYVSVAGRATLTQNQAKAEELWNPWYQAWFPQGLEDPNLGLIHVEVEGAEYWDAPSSPVVHLVGLVKAKLTGQAADDVADNEKMHLG